MRQFCGQCEKEVEVVADLRTNNKVCAVCGTIFQRFSLLPAGTIISGYMIESELGRGAMGIVYKAKQINLERHVALKILSEELANDMDFVDRFFNEARAAASLSHPNVVHAYDAGATPDGIYYLAMELVEGETLDALISREGRLPASSCLNIAVKITEALNYAWNKESLSHGDVKPDNIIVNNAGEIKLADLGLAKTRRDEVSEDNLFATPLYAAPEVIRGEIALIGAKSDMYSFGASLYHMVCGEPPFPGDDADKIMNAQVSKKHKPLGAKRRGVNPELSYLVDRLMSKSIEDRPDNWEEVVATLKRCAHPKKPTRDFAYFFLGRSANPWVFWAKLLGLVAFILIIIVIVALYFIRPPKTPESGASGPPGAMSTERIEDEWRRLKENVKFSSNKNMLRKFEEFSERYGELAPSEVATLQSELERKVGVVEKKASVDQRRKAEFADELEKTVASLREPSALRTLSKKKLLAIEKLLTAIQKKANQPLFDHLVTRERRLFFKSTLEETRRILAERGAAKKARKSKSPHHLPPGRESKPKLEESARRHPDKGGKSKGGKKRSVKAASAALDYYQFLSRLKEKHDPMNPPASVAEMNKWREQRGALPPRVSKRFEIMREALRKCPPLNQFCIDNSSLFEGESLPIRDLPAEFKVDEVNLESIKMFAKKEYESADGSIKSAKIGEILYWRKLSASERKAILESRLMNPTALSLLPKEELEGAVSLLISSGTIKSAESFERLASMLDAPARWRTFWLDFHNCRDEVEAFDNWKSIQECLAREDFIGVAQLLTDMIKNQAGTTCFKIHEKAITDLNVKYASLDPNSEALGVYERCVQSINEGRPYPALAAAMTLKSRYAGNPLILSKLRRKFIEATAKALKLVKANSDADTIMDTKIPFYYWEFDQPGEAQAYSEMASKIPMLAEYPSVLKGLSLAAALDCGDWLKARDRHSNFTADDVQNLQKVETSLVNWVPALLFGYGFASVRFNDNAARDDVRGRLAEMAENPPKLLFTEKSLVTTLAMEYALLVRDPPLALQLTLDYDFSSTGNPNIDVRVAILRLLSMLSKPDVDRKVVIGHLEDLRPFFEANPPLRHDYRWCEAGAHLLRNMPELSDEELLNLKNGACAAPDPCARFLLDVISMRRVQDGVKNDSPNETLHELFEEKISGNLLSGELWRKLMVFKLAEAPIDEWPRLLDESLSDVRVCAIKHYPLLVMLKAGSAVALKNMSPPLAEDYLTSRLENSSVVSLDEKKSVLMLKRKPSVIFETVGDAVFNGHYQSAYWLGVLGILANFDDSKVTGKLFNMINEHWEMLNWQERYLARSLRRRIGEKRRRR